MFEIFEIVQPLASPSVLLFVVVSLAGSACGGGKSNPSGPTSVSTGNTNPAPSPTPTPTPTPSPAPSGPTCRTYPTAANVTTVSGGTTMNALLAASFNSGTNTSTITTMFANGAPCTTSVFTYTSRNDFVDEVRTVPGISLQTATTTTNSGACGSGTSTVSYTYDAQRRLTSFTTNALGVSGTTTYTAWDSSGRPTTGSFPGTTIANVYNDTARALVQTQTTAGGSVSTGTVAFDANGAQLTSVVVSGANTTTTTYTNTATAQVCK